MTTLLSQHAAFSVAERAHFWRHRTLVKAAQRRSVYLRCRPFKLAVVRSCVLYRLLTTVQQWLQSREGP